MMTHTPMVLSKVNTRLIVIVGYCILAALAMMGFIIIYLEVLNSNRNREDDSTLKKELMDLNNTLATMYQAEGIANLLTFAENKELKAKYDSLMVRVFNQINSLRWVASNSDIHRNLDSLSVLLAKKQNNALEMVLLTRKIDNNILNEKIQKSVTSRPDFNYLDSFLVNVTRTREDTVHIVPEKKSFFKRLKEAIRSPTDSIVKVTKTSVSQVNELMAPFIADTIINLVRQVERKAQRENTEIVQQLIIQQHKLYAINELTGLQIQEIVDKLKNLEFQISMDVLKKKNELLVRSTSFVAIIGSVALIVALFFMTWTLKSLNKTQKWQISIQEAKKNVEKLLISREQLINTITHDIKAPISSIIGFLDLMSDDALSQKQHYYIENMNSSASHVLDLVKNLSDFQSLEEKPSQPKRVSFSPALLINNIYESFLPLAGKKNLKLELESSFSEDKKFLSDPYYIRMILINLLSNAVKFTPENGEIHLFSSLENDNRWRVSIQDTGPGIDPLDHTRIFDEFTRLDETKNRVDGTGLGLSISQKLASLLDGSIELESMKGTGSVFCLVTPLIPATEENQELKPDVLPETMTRILFVDDDTVQLNLLSELMRKENLPFACCSNAPDALRRLQEESFDMVFTDIHIPGRNGFELVKQIRNASFPRATTIPVIAFSAENQEIEDELIASGFDGFLLKPFKAGQLLEIIGKHTSFKRIIHDDFSGENQFGLEWLLQFVSNDLEAAKVVDSFIEEINKDKADLETAFRDKDEETIRQLSHKMLTLMRMVSANEIILLLNDFEKGNISEEKKLTLFRLMEEKSNEAEATRKILGEMINIKN